jgi:GNAT superfamily N-acetyltransferase
MLATWWVSDPLPQFSDLPGFRADLARDDDELARLNGISAAEVRTRQRAGHRPYIGYLDGTPAAYGWVATREASIGELDLSFALPPGERYLWDFATLPEWQGRGLYPRLLRAILVRESRAAARFWILHAPENLPSGAGMRKAGFVPVGRLSFQAGGRLGLAPLDAGDRAAAAAALLGVPLAETSVQPCWRCGASAGAPEAGAADACGCGSGASSPAARCACATEPRPSLITVVPSCPSDRTVAPPSPASEGSPGEQAGAARFRLRDRGKRPA